MLIKGLGTRTQAPGRRAGPDQRGSAAEGGPRATGTQSLSSEQLTEGTSEQDHLGTHMQVGQL